MRDYNNSLFDEIIEQVNGKRETTIDTKLLEVDFLNLKYFLTNNFYYVVIIDDYPFEISDKQSLLEALYYQVRLITVHGLNWDAIQEGFETLLNDNLNDFEGICLLFKQGVKLNGKLSEEFNVLSEIIQAINNQQAQKKIVLILNL